MLGYVGHAGTIGRLRWPLQLPREGARNPNKFPNNSADAGGGNGTQWYEHPDQTTRNSPGWTVVDGQKRTTDQKVGGSSPSERAGLHRL